MRMPRSPSSVTSPRVCRGSDELMSMTMDPGVMASRSPSSISTERTTAELGSIRITASALASSGTDDATPPPAAVSRSRAPGSGS